MLFRLLPISSLAIGLLGFLFTFCEVQCNHQPLARFSGITMLVGGQGEIDPAMKSMSRMAERLGQSTDAETPEQNKELRMSPNPLIIGSALLALATMVAVFRSRRGRVALPALIGAGLACALVLLARYDLESRMRDRLGQTDNPDKFSAAMSDLIQVEFGPGFYIPVFGFGLAFLFILLIPRLEGPIQPTIPEPGTPQFAPGSETPPETP